jgi:hypothetical protein
LFRVTQSLPKDTYENHRSQNKLRRISQNPARKALPPHDVGAGLRLSPAAGSQFTAAEDSERFGGKNTTISAAEERNENQFPTLWTIAATEITLLADATCR